MYIAARGFYEVAHHADHLIFQVFLQIVVIQFAVDLFGD